MIFLLTKLSHLLHSLPVETDNGAQGSTDCLSSPAPSKWSISYSSAVKLNFLQKQVKNYP